MDYSEQNFQLIIVSRWNSGIGDAADYHSAVCSANYYSADYHSADYHSADYYSADYYSADYDSGGVPVLGDAGED